MKFILPLILTLAPFLAGAAIDFPGGLRKDYGSIKCAEAAKTAAEAALATKPGSILGFKLASESGRYRTFEMVESNNSAKSQSAFVRTKKSDCDIVEVDLNI